MKRKFGTTLFVAGIALLALAAPVSAQQDGEIESHDFDGGTITITRDASGEREIAVDGEVLSQEPYAAFNEEIEVAGIRVALLLVGSGGNACAPATLIVWRQEGKVVTDLVGEGCAGLEPAVTNQVIYFMPHLSPGASGDVFMWTPEKRVTLAGRLSYTPQPDSGWPDLQRESLEHITEAFENTAVYSAAQKLLGRSFDRVIEGLSVGSAPQALPSGVWWASGCIPHSCGDGNSFMAIDQAGRKLYFAQQSDGDTPKSWPPAAKWPKEVRNAMRGAIGR